MDLLAEDGRLLVVVEVRTTTSGGDPIEAVGHAKRDRVRHLAAGVGAERVDFLGIRMGEGAVDFHWVQS